MVAKKQIGDWKKNRHVESFAYHCENDFHEDMLSKKQTKNDGHTYSMAKEPSLEEHDKNCEICENTKTAMRLVAKAKKRELDETQTVESRMEKTFRKAGESEDEIVRTRSFMQMARAEEREKVLDESGILHGKDAERFLKETKLKGKI